MKVVETKLYNIEELEPQFRIIARMEYLGSFLHGVTPIDEIWFTRIGNLYAIFNA